MNKKIRVAIADDHQIFRKGLTLLLEELDFVNIVGKASNGQEVLDILEKKDVDIILMDMKMPVMDGIKATQKTLELYPDVKIIALSMFEEEEYVKSMVKAGAKGYILKNIEKNELEKAIKTVSEGNNYFSGALSTILMNKMMIDTDENNLEHVKLSTREIDVLHLICEGLTNQEIAEKLNISQRTVDGHRSSILSKTGTNNTAGLVSFAIRKKLVDL